ncbi:NAD(P)H dehydrogenase (quinone) [Variovorax sp. WDL1]|nr:multimeric flavodoxin WrbA [Variovorax sp. WDL1]PNG59972.1 NAD(P)H dehydrogenase (quinone) [Variovorax sp. B4]PNG60236.1 NAD(P)H dehydrogenase (quinone) [Variovorax sp. B2]VTV13931.1 NAD(P)H dehydrogenase (quinone) [Variovorax sp. WDL1]
MNTIFKPKVLVAFYSRNSSTELLARAIAEGAAGEGAEVRLRRARELVSPAVMQQSPGWVERAEKMNARYEAPAEADAEWADAIVLGTPTRFGSISSELKAYIDGLGGLWFQGKLNGKVGSAFGATSSLHGGNESTLLSMYTPMAHLGLIIVPLGYADAAMFKAGTPYGATHVSKLDTVEPDAEHLDVARFQGRRVATVARALRGGSSVDSAA